MFRRILIPFFVIALLIVPAVTRAQDSTPPTLEVYQIEVLNTYPHDPAAFTQGLVYHEGELYESTGNCCPSYSLQSDLRRVDIETGEVLQSVAQDTRFFSEGLALVDDRLIQLTWQEGAAIVYDLETFEPQTVFQYNTEGWGLCYDGTDLYMSDGSSLIMRRDPETFEVIGGIPVIFQGDVVRNINELECVGDYIYANVWKQDVILIIDKYTGFVVGVIDATGLLQNSDVTLDELSVMSSSSDVLNGIAYNPDTDTFYITGKHWPRLFEVQFVPFEQQ